MTGTPPAEGPLLETLRSGESLCALVNALRPGGVARVTSAAAAAAMPDNKRSALLRQNISQYLDACAALGLPAAELFDADDLYEAKNFFVVLQSLDALARRAQTQPQPQP